MLIICTNHQNTAANQIVSDFKKNIKYNSIQLLGAYTNFINIETNSLLCKRSPERKDSN